MCGIAGILAINHHQDSLASRIERMQMALQHRGPDDKGIYISKDHQVALAHTRLSILDLSAAGHQPMSTPCGRYWITFNGEIYNFQQLRQNLISQGEQFQSQTDTEVILKLYQRIGADCVNHLRGMFAFAIWDDLEKTCFLARDPLGIKPLYYWQSSSTIAFASELRAIVASGLPPVNLSVEGLYGYLINGSVPEPYTLIEGVRCLSAGHWLQWQSGNIIQKQYWRIQFTPEKISPQEAREITRTALVDSIKHHFISDVPVGIFLSGGIDSTSVLALASQTQSQQLQTYSVAFEEQKWSEGEIAQRAAKHFGANHTEYKITASIAKNLLPRYLEAIDQPSVDGFNTFCVSQIAHDNGTKVVLSGLGGDELFGGYRSFQKVPKMVTWGKHLHTIPQLAILFGKGLAHWGRTSQTKRLGDFLQQPSTISNAYHSFRGIFSHNEARAILQQYINLTPLPSSFPVCREGVGVGFQTPQDEVSFLELTSYMRNQLLRDSDVMSMNWGLELRVPLVDQNLLEVIATIPSNIRLAQGKQLLIQAVPELPEWIYNRRKQGFSFPLETWISGELKDYFSNINCPKNIPLTPWYRRWGLLVLQHWWRQISK
ncbi:MAG: asparagine synthase (glutamine-hydrolyzing) [Calothrix sp. C42_A2020_038]|nr:asparagine synthase (glutamine-hydrolyzing) [Calothrix sp. C42_A2020_038]